MSSFAKNTQVSTQRSREEIEKTLSRYGADQFLYGSENGRAVIGFRAHGRLIRFELILPDPKERKFTHNHRGWVRSKEQLEKELEQASRQRWRALALVVKAKLEAVESGITTFEDEFLAHVVLPNGLTFGSWAAPQLEAAYAGGSMPALLPGGQHGS